MASVQCTGDSPRGSSGGAPSPKAAKRRGALGWIASGAAGAATAVWTYVTDEAAAEGVLPNDEPTPASDLILAGAEGIDLTVSLAGAGTWSQE